MLEEEARARAQNSWNFPALETGLTLTGSQNHSVTRQGLEVTPLVAMGKVEVRARAPNSWKFFPAKNQFRKLVCQGRVPGSALSPGKA